MAKPRKTGGDLRFISKAAAMAAVEQMRHHNAVMAMALSVLMRRYGAHFISRAELTACEPEKLHIRGDMGDMIKFWWGDEEPKSPSELMAVEDNGDDGAAG